jgi:phosphomannomutase
MARLITIAAMEGLPPSLEVHLGDLVVVEASGAHQLDGEEVACLLGVFLQSVVGLHHQVLTPAGSPNAVVIHARGLGVAHLEMVTGDPWRSVRTVPFALIVSPGEGSNGEA